MSLRSNLKTTRLFDLPILCESKVTLIHYLEAHVSAKEKHPLFIATPNPEQVVQAHHDPIFKRALESADILLPDGIGLVYASRLLSHLCCVSSISQRITGIDVVQSLLQLAARHHWKVLVVGGRGYGVTKGSEMVPLQIEPAFLPTGATQTNQEWYWLEGFADVQHPTSEEKKHLKKTLLSFQPDILFVAFGAPYQETWLESILPLLQETEIAIAMAVGGSFDVLTGQLPRAPLFFQKLGLEWLYRLIKEPWRWKRQLRLITFSTMVLRELVK